MPQGISIRTTSSGIPVIRLHYSCIPNRGPEWVAREKPRYASVAMWNQEQEIDYSAAGGERVLRDLLIRRWKEIVITDPYWQADPGWRYSNGLDYGKTHPCAFVSCAVDFDGNRYALAEAVRKGLAPAQHVPDLKRMRLPCVDNGMNPLILSKAMFTRCDPSMGWTNQATEEAFTSVVALFQKAGMPRLQVGIRGQDLTFVDQIIEAWSAPVVRFRIVCRNMPFPVEPGSMKYRDGVWENGCPNLLWELLNIRRKERSALRQETQGPAEALVDKDNDAFDALKYWWTGEELTPQVSADQKWRDEVSQLRKNNPEIDLNTLSMLHARWKQKTQQAAVKTWR